MERYLYEFLLFLRNLHTTFTPIKFAYLSEFKYLIRLLRRIIIQYSYYIKGADSHNIPADFGRVE